MSINPSEYKPHRLQPSERLERDPNEDEKKDARKRKVSYQGRSWQEEEEDLPVQPHPSPPEKKGGSLVYADQALLEAAERFLLRFVTIEEKVAQLFFYSTEAFYEVDNQKFVETLIQEYQIGGLLFTKGEFRRQLYLIEHFQSLSKTPLLIGNDFLHGLSFYFQGELPFALLETMDERKSSDLGKAVVYQNRKLGVHFQFDAEENNKLKPNLARSFRNGIREAQGVVARDKISLEVRHKPIKVVENPLLQLFSKSENIQEAYGLRTFHFVTISSQDDFRQKSVEAFSGSGDAILMKEAITEAIDFLSDEIKSGRLKESDLDKKVIKILLLKRV